MTPIQIITVEPENKPVRIMVERTTPNLYRAYFSIKWGNEWFPYSYSNLEDSDRLKLLSDCISVIVSREGAIVCADNQISDIYTSNEIKSILNLSVISES